MKSFLVFTLFSIAENILSLAYERRIEENPGQMWRDLVIDFGALQSPHITGATVLEQWILLLKCEARVKAFERLESINVV